MDQSLAWMFSRVGIVAFDLDGTLVDSFQRNYHATNRFLEARNIDSVPEDWVREHVMPNSVPTILDYMGDHLGLSTQADNQRLYETLLVDEAHRTKIMSAAPGLLSYLKDQGKQLALVTNCSRKEAQGSLELLVNELGYDPFSAIATMDIIESSKPSAKFMEYVFEKIGKKDYVVIGDSDVDIMLAKNTHPLGTSIFIGDKPLKVQSDFTYSRLQDLYAALR